MYPGSQSHEFVMELKVLWDVDAQVKHEVYPKFEHVKHFKLHDIHTKVIASLYWPGGHMQEVPLKIVNWFGLQVKQYDALKLHDPQSKLQAVHTPPFSKYPSLQ
jgi:hypothetical protein